MKLSRACTGMWFSENDDFKFLNNCEKHKQHVLHAHHSSRAPGTVLSLQTSVSLTRNINVKLATELYYIFSKILKFRFFFFFRDFSLSLSIYYCEYVYCLYTEKSKCCMK